MTTPSNLPAGMPTQNYKAHPRLAEIQAVLNDMRARLADSLTAQSNLARRVQEAEGHFYQVQADIALGNAEKAELAAAKIAWDEAKAEYQNFTPVDRTALKNTIQELRRKYDELDSAEQQKVAQLFKPFYAEAILDLVNALEAAEAANEKVITLAEHGLNTLGLPQLNAWPGPIPYLTHDVSYFGKNSLRNKSPFDFWKDDLRMHGLLK